jgi:hypothetical protein
LRRASRRGVLRQARRLDARTSAALIPAAPECWSTRGPRGAGGRGKRGFVNPLRHHAPGSAIQQDCPLAKLVAFFSWTVSMARPAADKLLPLSSHRTRQRLC